MVTGKCIGQDSYDCRQFYLEKVSNNNLINTNLKLLISDEFFLIWHSKVNREASLRNLNSTYKNNSLYGCVFYAADSDYSLFLFIDDCACVHVWMVQEWVGLMITLNLWT